MNFKNILIRIFNDIDQLICDNGAINPLYKDLTEVHNELLRTIDNIDKPLCVAIAGAMKAGKSTLLNALLGEKLSYTGEAITTYTPTWFKYAENREIELVFNDGRTAKIAEEGLEHWTSINKREENKDIENVKYVIYYYPNELLKRIEIIDTPGLLSPEDKDSDKTVKLLGLGNIDEVNVIGEKQVSMADAIIYAFTANFKESDLQTVKSFTSNPINAIGIFTRVDESYWYDPGIDDNINVNPTEKINNIVIKYAEKLKNNLYSILPIIAKPVEGIDLLNERDWEVLKYLSQFDPEEAFFEYFPDEETFEKINILNSDAEQRKKIFSLLGQYGIYLLSSEIKKGKDKKQILESIKKICGFNKLFDLLESHFANRTLFIKADVSVSRIQRAVSKVKNNSSGIVLAMCNQLEIEIDSVKQLKEFREIELLKEFYEGQFKFTDPKDNESFVRLMGEKGSGIFNKFDIDFSATFNEINEKIKSEYNHWKKVSNSELFHKNRYRAEKVVDILSILMEYFEKIKEY